MCTLNHNITQFPTIWSILEATEFSTNLWLVIICSTCKILAELLQFTSKIMPFLLQNFATWYITPRQPTGPKKRNRYRHVKAGSWYITKAPIEKPGRWSHVVGFAVCLRNLLSAIIHFPIVAFTLVSIIFSHASSPTPMLTFSLTTYLHTSASLWPLRDSLAAQPTCSPKKVLPSSPWSQPLTNSFRSTIQYSM